MTDAVSTAPAPPYSGYGAGAIGPGTRPAVVVVDLTMAADVVAYLGRVAAPR